MSSLIHSCRTYGGLPTTTSNPPPFITSGNQSCQASSGGRFSATTLFPRTMFLSRAVSTCPGWAVLTQNDSRAMPTASPFRSTPNRLSVRMVEMMSAPTMPVPAPSAAWNPSASRYAAWSWSNASTRNAPLPHDGSTTRTVWRSSCQARQNPTSALRWGSFRWLASNTRGSSRAFTAVPVAACWRACRRASNRSARTGPRVWPTTYRVTASGV